MAADQSTHASFDHAATPNPAQPRSTYATWLEASGLLETCRAGAQRRKLSVQGEQLSGPPLKRSVPRRWTPLSTSGVLFRLTASYSRSYRRQPALLQVLHGQHVWQGGTKPDI